MWTRLDQQKLSLNQLKYAGISFNSCRGKKKYRYSFD